MQAYLEYQTRVMQRWCRLYARPYEDFIVLCAARFRNRHHQMLW